MWVKNYTTFEHLVVNVEITKVRNLILAEHPNLRQMHQIWSRQIQHVDVSNSNSLYEMVQIYYQTPSEAFGSGEWPPVPSALLESVQVVPLINTLQDFLQHEAVLPHFSKTILQSLYPSPRCVNPHRPIFPKSHSVKSLRYCELHKSLTSHQDKKTHDNCAFVRTDRRFLREIGFRNRRGPKFPENLIFKMSLILAEIVK
jgi:hypothetical protein